MLVMLIRLGLKQDAVPDVPMRPEEPISRVARSRTVRQVMRGESFVNMVLFAWAMGFMVHYIVLYFYLQTSSAQ